MDVLFMRNRVRTILITQRARALAFASLIVAGCGGSGGEGEYGQKFDAPAGAQVKSAPVSQAKQDLSGKGRRTETEVDKAAPAKKGGRR
jgi:hypothetical protein